MSAKHHSIIGDIPPPPTGDSTGTYPRTKLLIRTREGVRAYFGPPTEPARELNVLEGVVLQRDPDYVTISTPATTAKSASTILAPIFCQNGTLGAVLLPSGAVAVSDGPSGNTILEIPSDPNTMYIEFSPLGTFLVTWSRPVASRGTDSEADSSNNLKVWKASNGECVVSYSQKQYRKDLIQWTQDESFCCRIVSNEVHILNGHQLQLGIIGKIRHKGVSSCKICPVSSKPYIGVFTPAVRGNHGQVALYRYVVAPTSAVPAGESAPAGTCIVTRGVMGASEANMHWSPIGVALLVHSQSDVDSSNSSYYGASGLSILSCKGCIDPSTSDKDLIDPVAVAVSQGKDGHIHDVKWSPLGHQFVISAGSMPCVCTLHDQNGTLIFSFGTAHRNTVSWSPHGRFLCLAGFGNLVGDMDFYDTQAKKIRKMGSNNAHCSVTHAWSPDSRYFMTATLAPRMNVDNGFKIFRYDGQGPIYTEMMDSCYEANWLPTPAAVYPNRGRSPSRNPPAPPAGEEGKEAAPVPSVKLAVPAPVAAYRAPGSTGALAEAMKRPPAQASKVAAASNAKPLAASASAAPAKYVPPPRKIPGLPPGATGAAGQKKTAPPPARR